MAPRLFFVIVAAAALLAVGTAGASAPRFSAKLVGSSPMQYLTQWRMHLAERDLCQTDQPIAGVAYRLGYTSESAFSNAFKRIKGVAPRAYRVTAHRADPAATRPASISAF